jgi:hypothetical protein
MNKAFDHNGTIVSASRPVKQLKTVKKTILIDSADRDTVKYYTNGDVVYFLPRVYENVVSIRLKSATFPRILAETSPGAVTHQYINSTNSSTGYDATADGAIATNDTDTPQYFLVEIEGLNKCDETSISAEKSSLPDNFFARIPTVLSQLTKEGYFIYYSDNSLEENKAVYSPAIGKLDRIHVVTRLHSKQDKTAFIYWTSTGAVADGTVEKAAGSNYSLVLEIEMLENGFDEFSSFETRIHNRDFGNFGC